MKTGLAHSSRLTRGPEGPAGGQDRPEGPRTRRRSHRMDTQPSPGRRAARGGRMATPQTGNYTAAPRGREAAGEGGSCEDGGQGALGDELRPSLSTGVTWEQSPGEAGIRPGRCSGEAGPEPNAGPRAWTPSQRGAAWGLVDPARPSAPVLSDSGSRHRFPGGRATWVDMSVVTWLNSVRPE